MRGEETDDQKRYQVPPPGRGLFAALLRGTLLVGGLQAFIKVLGFLEKVVLGGVYGTDSPRYAAYLVAFEVLLVLSEVLKLSVIPSLVPALEGVRRREGEGSALRLAGRFATVIVLLVMALVVVPGVVFAGPLLRATFAREWLADPARRDYVGLMTAFLRVFLSGAVFTGAGVCTYALLNSYRRFGLAALGDLAFKVLGLASFLFVGFVLGLREQALLGLVGGIFAGCAGFVGVHAVGLWRMGRLRGIRPGLALGDRDLRRTLVLFAPLFLSVLLFNGRRIFDKLFAAQMELADYVAAQDFGFRFVETPYRFLIEPFAIVVLPFLAGLAAERDRTAFRRTAMAGLRALLLVFVPVSVGLYLLRYPFIQVMLERGRFDAASTYLTCGALGWYLLALPLWGLDVLIQRMYFAARDTLRPALFEAAAMGLYLALALTWRGSLRHEGLALAFGLSRLLKVALLAAFLRSKLGGLEAGRNLAFLGRLAVAAAAMGGAVYGVARLFQAPAEVQVWIEAEGERFVYRAADGAEYSGRSLASSRSGEVGAIVLAPGGVETGRLRFVLPRTDRYHVWVRAGAPVAPPPSGAPNPSPPRGEGEGEGRGRSRLRTSNPHPALSLQGRGFGAPAAPQLTVTIDGRPFKSVLRYPMHWVSLADDLPLAAGLHEVDLGVSQGAVEVDALVVANPAGSLADFAPGFAERPEVGPRGVRAVSGRGLLGRRLAALVVGGALGLAVYLIVLRLLGTEELAAVRRLLSRHPNPEAEPQRHGDAEKSLDS